MGLVVEKEKKPLNIVNIVDFCHFEVFGRTKLHKKGSRNMIFLLLKNVIAILM